MWTPLALWNHPADESEHLKFAHVSSCDIRSKNLKSMKSKLSRFWNQRFSTSQCGVIKGNYFIVQCCLSGQHH